MNNRFRHLVLTASLCVAVPHLAIAQESESTLDKLLDPIVDLLPDPPEDAQTTHDEGSIKELMKLVDLSRTIGGSLIEIVNAVIEQTVTLESIREAQLGTRTIPMFNEEDEVAGRAGGFGLNEMANAALNGSLDAPEDLQEAFEKFRDDYELEKAFELKDSDSFSRVLTAHATAQGAISASTGEASYKRANASMDRLDSYMAALQTSADLKTSIDLNTRVTIEMTQQINESIRTQAAIASMAGGYFMFLGGESGQDNLLDMLKDFNR